MTKCAELLNRTIDVDFVDINVGCPIDLVYKKVTAARLWSLEGVAQPRTLSHCPHLDTGHTASYLWAPTGSVCISCGVTRVSVSHRVVAAHS